MKTLIVAFAAFLSASFPCALNARADEATGRTYIVGVSPNLDKPDRESAFKALVMLALEESAPRDVVIVYDALNLQPIARLAIPDGPPADQNPRARIQKLKTEFTGLQRFFATDSHSKAEEAGLIHLPQFLALASSQLRPTDKPVTVMVIGSPLYIDAAEPTFNMTDAHYPSDGHLLADQKTSVFGVGDKKDALKGVSVHYSYLRENFANDTARNRIQRFWTLFVGEQAGVLATFAPDISLVFERARQNVQHPCTTVSIDKEDSKIQMHQAAQRELRAKADFGNEAASTNDGVTPIKQPAAHTLEIKESATELKINVVGDVVFDFDEAEIRMNAQPTLDQVLKLIQEHPNASVLIEGHSDAKGSPAYNLKLSDRRAASVKAWLVSKGIAEQNVWSRGCGAAKPVAANSHPDGSDDPEGRQRNRRVEITIKK